MMRPSPEQQVQARQLLAGVTAVPYATNAAHEAGDLESCGAGNCHAKAWRLHEGLTGIGYEARIVRWTYQLGDPYRSLLPSDLDMHTAVEFRIEGTWRLVDPALDDGLSVSDWDGLVATKPAFEPCSPVWIFGRDDEAIAASVQGIERALADVDSSRSSTTNASTSAGGSCGRCTRQVTRQDT